MKHPVRFALTATIAACALLRPTPAATPAATLAQDFAAPPSKFQPWAYYFFESQTMDLPGITADLEALASVGIGGLMVFAEHREGMKTGNVRMFSAEYAAGIRHLLQEAARLGLVINLENCPGSATAGGPWNGPEHSMKQFVWTETPVAGGAARTLKLRQPQTIAGFYRDIAVVAYPVSAGGRRPLGSGPRLSAPEAAGNVAAMTDGDMLTSTLFRGGTNRPREIRLEYAEPIGVGRLYVHGNLFRYTQPLNYELEVSEDGATWRKIAAATQQGNNPAVADFPPVTARYFRVWASSQLANFWVAELALLPPGGRPRSYPQFNDWASATGREKEAFADFRPLLLADDRPFDPAHAVDLSARLQPDGSVTWEVPRGEWLVWRMGYTTSGKKNHPAAAEGLGYEVDKFDPVLVRRHAEEGLRRMTGGAPDAPALKMFHVDSWEAGGQSWTERLEAEFENRNGYSLRPFLPVLGGRLVGEAETTRRFLEDFRRTLQALVTESFYGGMAEVIRSHGLKFVAESSASAFPIHRPLDYFKHVDIPAGEAWTLGDFSPTGNIMGGLRDAVSAAHLLGRPVTPIEVFTSHKGNWNISPRFLKAFGDKMLATGANQLTLHCYIHQPSGDRAPGWTMNHFGSTFNRHVTWWKQAKPWLLSITRSQFLLRQGRTVADFCRLLGDDEAIAPHKDQATFWDAPPGYANDWTSGDNLLNQFRVEQGELVAGDGTARYRLLVLPDRERMTLEVARRLHELVEAGAVIHGRRPSARVGRRGGEAADREFARHVAALWGDVDSARPTRSVGQGRVLTGTSVAAALAALNLQPDLAWIAGDPAATVHWHHRRDDRREIYFLANGGEVPLRATFSFRVAGRAPALWSPETGEISRPAVYRLNGDRVELPLELGPAESLFVVFEPDAAGTHFEGVTRDGQRLWPRNQAPASGFPRALLQPDGTLRVAAMQSGEYRFEPSAPGPAKTVRVTAQPAVELTGTWRVDFDGVAAPETQILAQLIPWNRHSDPSVRFFSGTGEYRQEFMLDAGAVAGAARTWLDLGEVRELAEVVLNGAPLGVVWKPPFRIDVTGKLRAGRNEIRIRVINTWANRLIGDLALPEAARHTWTSFPHYTKTDVLPDSGLLGPVALLVVEHTPEK